MPVWFYVFTSTETKCIAAFSASAAVLMLGLTFKQVRKMTYVNMTTPELESYWASKEI